MAEGMRGRLEIERIGTDTISNTLLFKSIYKSLSVKEKLNSAVTPRYIETHTESKVLMYHPMWIVKNLILAGRPPFPPKRIPRVIFVDAVSGYRGLFSHVPHLTTETVCITNVVAPFIDEQTIETYVSDVRAKQINRSYLMKKPEHINEGTSLAYLPVFKVKVNSEHVTRTFFINANTGENEQFMSDRWTSGKDLIR